MSGAVFTENISLRERGSGNLESFTLVSVVRCKAKSVKHVNNILGIKVRSCLLLHLIHVFLPMTLMFVLSEAFPAKFLA